MLGKRLGDVAEDSVKAQVRVGIHQTERIRFQLRCRRRYRHATELGVNHDQGGARDNRHIDTADQAREIGRQVDLNLNQQLARKFIQHSVDMTHHRLNGFAILLGIDCPLAVRWIVSRRRPVFKAKFEQGMQPLAVLGRLHRAFLDAARCHDTARAGNHAIEF